MKKISILGEKVVSKDYKWLEEILSEQTQDLDKISIKHAIANLTESLVLHKNDNENEFVFSNQIDSMFKELLFRLSEKTEN